jgi:hypothetical protein
LPGGLQIQTSNKSAEAIDCGGFYLYINPHAKKLFFTNGAG